MTATDQPKQIISVIRDRITDEAEIPSYYKRCNQDAFQIIANPA